MKYVKLLPNLVIILLNWWGGGGFIFNLILFSVKFQTNGYYLHIS